MTGSCVRTDSSGYYAAFGHFTITFFIGRQNLHFCIGDDSALFMSQVLREWLRTSLHGKQPYQGLEELIQRIVEAVTAILSDAMHDKLDKRTREPVRMDARTD